MMQLDRIVSILHRNIKPSNILLGNRSSHLIRKIYRVDFGFAMPHVLSGKGTVVDRGNLWLHSPCENRSMDLQYRSLSGDLAFINFLAVSWFLYSRFHSFFLLTLFFLESFQSSIGYSCSCSSHLFQLCKRIRFIPGEVTIDSWRQHCNVPDCLLSDHLLLGQLAGDRSYLNADFVPLYGLHEKLRHRLHSALAHCWKRSPWVRFTMYSLAMHPSFMSRDCCISRDCWQPSSQLLKSPLSYTLQQQNIKTIVNTIETYLYQFMFRRNEQTLQKVKLKVRGLIRQTPSGREFQPFLKLSFSTI